MRIVPGRNLAAGSTSAASMSTANVPAVAAAFLTRPHRFPLGGRNDGINLLPFSRMNLLDLLPLLLDRKR